MASVKFQVRGKRNPSKITARLIIDKDNDFRRSTPILVNPRYFNNKGGKVRQIAEFTDKLSVQEKLDDLRHYIIQEYNKAVANSTYINSDWLQNCIDSKFEVVKKTDHNILTNYCELYVDRLKHKTNDKTGEVGSSKATITKYNTIKTKIENFEKHTRKKYRLTDVNLKFRNAFLKYLLEKDKLARNTAGRYLKFLKTICLDAQRYGYQVSPELPLVKGFKVEVEKIYLTFDEIEKISNTEFEEEHYKAARDWLVIGCFIGQRVSDLLKLTNENIVKYKGRNFIELVQQKTKTKVTILIHPKVEEILKKYKWDFPPKYSKNFDSSKAKFNLYIKHVAFEAGLEEKIEGAKIHEKKNRKESGVFPKWQLVTSHICRRSFATNHYGELPTPLLINVTGHSTEREFLNYIGKTPIDYADQMASYWDRLTNKNDDN
ncbi:phage integrase SAM-like domain-containing protein [Christiangramia portivictoriae]|uniref:phage integrase SAM-like domain-containing protein n=1 Tax=Christiangramia portivictoriae TaxID=326069 RepID=UPI00040C47D8|nr:phage integrase SAM-like domain-containing protein [Christiangramia portivictoriae]